MPSSFEILWHWVRLFDLSKVLASESVLSQDRCLTLELELFDALPVNVAEITRLILLV